MTDKTNFKEQEPQNDSAYAYPVNPTPQPPVLQESEEHTLALFSHLSILLNLITGYLGLIPPVIIYFAYKDRSKFVARQSLQAIYFQLVFFFLGGLLSGFLWAITGVLSFVLIGLCCIPLALIVSLIPFGSLVYGIIAAIDSYNGKDFRYWLVGNWVD